MEVHKLARKGQIDKLRELLSTDSPTVLVAKGRVRYVSCFLPPTCVIMIRDVGVKSSAGGMDFLSNVSEKSARSVRGRVANDSNTSDMSQDQRTVLHIVAREGTEETMRSLLSVFSETTLDGCIDDLDYVS
jgi:hypothetical protein